VKIILPNAASAPSFVAGCKLQDRQAFRKVRGAPPLVFS
jgi:hypothetical protein